MANPAVRGVGSDADAARTHGSAPCRRSSEGSCWHAARRRTARAAERVRLIALQKAARASGRAIVWLNGRRAPVEARTAAAELPPESRNPPARLRDPA